MSQKKIFLGCGIFFIILAFGTFLPNSLLGSTAFFATNFLHNLIHFLIGFLVIFVFYFSYHKIEVVALGVGFFLLGLAVVGSWYVGAGRGVLCGVLLNGVGNVFNAFFGIVFVILGSMSYRLKTNV